MPEDNNHIPVVISADETPLRRTVRAVLGDSSNQAIALAEALQSVEPEIAALLQDQERRNAFVADPVTVLRELLPEPEVLEPFTRQAGISPELSRELQRFQLQYSAPSPPSPAEDLLGKILNYVAASPANLAAFTGSFERTVRGIDPAASQAAVDQVLAAFDTVRGILRAELVSPQYWAQTLAGPSARAAGRP
jgi:hypothetical protein